MRMRLSLAFVPLVLLGGVALLAAPAIAPKKGPDAPKKLPDVALAPASEDWAVFDKPGKFITALCATDDTLWIGTEDNSLWRLDLTADSTKPEAWQQFTSQDTATDHVYGLAVDAAGRLWCGTLNQGVSVYNGREWRNYGVLDGCSGERVFAIAADRDPSRGNVWIGTDHGLVSWTPSHEVPATATAAEVSTAKPAAPSAGDGSKAVPAPEAPLAKGTWRTFTQVDGLPSQQIYAVAVTGFGRVWVGTECDGLAWADPPYDKWTLIRAEAEKSGDTGEAPGCDGGTASGLPSNLTNALAVFKDGTTVVSTDYGLGIRRAGELKWTSWQGLSKEPYENYSRGLAVDAAGGLWIATRQKGLARFDLKAGTLKTWTHAVQGPSLPDDYVFDVAVGPKGDVWAGTYGGGLARLRPTSPSSASRPAAVGASWSSAVHSALRVSRLSSPLPVPLSVPALEELNSMLADLSKPMVGPNLKVARMGDDWLTRGDWIGRYGDYGATLCAMGGGANDMRWGDGTDWCYRAWIGGRCNKGDSLRFWVHWLTTSDPRVLQNPALGGRKQSDWDDHGEVYPMSQGGPNIYVSLLVPQGDYVLALYFINKDGHEGNNRLRDYVVTVKETPGMVMLVDGLERADGRGDHAQAEKVFNSLPVLAVSRVRDFWNPAYQRFFLSGPRTITVKIDRNGSFNTILSAVFLDHVAGPQKEYYVHPRGDRGAGPLPERKAGKKVGPTETLVSGGSGIEGASILDAKLREVRKGNPCWYSINSRPYWVRLLPELRRQAKEDDALSRPGFKPVLVNCLDALGLFARRDEVNGGIPKTARLWLYMTNHEGRRPETPEDWEVFRRGGPVVSAKARGLGGE